MTPQQLRALSAVGTLGFSMPLCIVLGLLAGKWLDGVLGTSSIFLISGTLLGVVAAFWTLWKETKKQ